MTGDDGFIFQLTPSRRATERRRDDKRREGISTHAHTEGARKRCAAESHTGISTHALTEGDKQVGFNSHMKIISTHALTEGDCQECGCEITDKDISTHALTEGDLWSRLR